MKVMFPSRFLVAIALLFSSTLVIAQNSVQLFGPAYERKSPTTAGYSPGNPDYPGMPYTFNSSSVSLTCGASPTASLSGPLMMEDGSAPSLSGGNLQPGGNLLVDNNVLVTVTPSGSSAGPTQNICVGGADDGEDPNNPNPPSFINNCFNPNYRNILSSIQLQNPDTYGTSATEDGPLQTPDFIGGVPAIDISSMLTASAGKTTTVNIALVDEGGSLVGSSVFFTTNCTINGVGAGTVSGNPINGSQGDTQTFTFNPNTSGLKGIQFGYDVSGALNNLSQNIPGTVPQVADTPVDSSLFQSTYVPGTSFATSNCMIHNGEVLTGTKIPACKLYTLECLSPTDSSLAGANCPISNQVNEVFNETFDGPKFNLYDIHNKSGGVIHEGIGFLMASDEWPGGAVNCTFDANSGPAVANLACPQNLITSFTGPGGFTPTGIATNPNSEFIVVYGVPEDKTDVDVAGQIPIPGLWVNTSTPTLKFDSQAPNLTPAANGYPYIMVSGVKKPVPGASKYIPEPIKSITYGITPIGTVPNPVSEPIATDITLLNPNANCHPGALTQTTVPDFITSSTVTSQSALTDGQYVVHYYAQDCAGTQELNFTMAPGTGVWSTNFYTIPLNIDTAKPVVTVTSPLSVQTYAKGSKVYASYYCTDAGFVQGGPNTGSGVVLCGTHVYGIATTYNTGTLQTQLNTSATGNNKSLTIYAIDGAANTSSTTVYYNVH